MSYDRPAAGPFGSAFANKSVLVTGHTGFKGAWLSAWLNDLGARVTGFALEPHTDPSAFELLGLRDRIDHRTGDVRDPAMVQGVVEDVQPAFVLHLAAQALVREGYASPQSTFDTNLMGTVNVMDAVRTSGRPCTVVIVTTDKCYHIEDRPKRYAEDERLGGRDPYSASKACAEIAVEAYRRSFFSVGDFASHGVALASARAGNVIGGGDWGADRLVPDIIRALTSGNDVLVRNPDAVRPWQHVLEPLSGYLWLAARLAANGPAGLAEGWNFGPAPDDHITVSELVERMLKRWGSGSWRPAPDATAPHEASYLGLECGKARSKLGWLPAYDIETAVESTVDWYKSWHAGEPVHEFTSRQIEHYTQAAARAGAAWASGLGAANA